MIGPSPIDHRYLFLLPRPAGIFPRRSAGQAKEAWHLPVRGRSTKSYHKTGPFSTICLAEPLNFQDLKRLNHTHKQLAAVPPRLSGPGCDAAPFPGEDSADGAACFPPVPTHAPAARFRLSSFCRNSSGGSPPGQRLPGESPAVVRPCGVAHSHPRNANRRMNGRKGMAACHAFSGTGSGEPQKRHTDRISILRQRACHIVLCLLRTRPQVSVCVLPQCLSAASG